jgi:esterase/lipase
MYNKKCFISPNQAKVQIKAITELKYEDNTINETAKFSYLTKRKRRHKKLKVEKQSEHSISPSKKSNIYDSSDEDYPYYISQ